MILEIIKQDRDDFQEHLRINVDEKVYQAISIKVWNRLIKLMDATFRGGYERGLPNSIYDELEIAPTLQCAREINIKLKKYEY